MMVFRCSKLSDLDAIHALASQYGYGITTLPKDKKLLSARLKWSEESFAAQVSKPKHEYYFFVLEDSAKQKVVGTSAIEASTGYASPFYSYKLSNKTRICNSLNIRSEYKVLSLVNDYQGFSEICTLYLEPNYRIAGNGLLLSRSRFLFMAENRDRFAATVIAEMRGISDEQGNSPFWDNFGQHFFHMSFIEADHLTIATDKQFIADLMPRNPVYVSLLSKDAQDAIGKPHASSLAAMNILLKEGFRYTNYVDIFDAGPTLEAPLMQIKTIADSQNLTIASICDDLSADKYIITNTSSNFRAVISEVVVNAEKETGIISKEAAEHLKVKVGERLRISPA